MPTETLSKEALKTENETALGGPSPVAIGFGWLHDGVRKLTPDPSQLTLENLAMMRDDDAVFACISLKKLLIQQNIRPYEHPSEEITGFVRSVWEQMEGSLAEYIHEAVETAIWSGVQVTEIVLGPILTGKYSGKWGIRKLKVLDPFSISPTGLRTDKHGNLLEVVQYRGIAELETTLPLERTVVWQYMKRHGNVWGAKALRPAWDAYTRKQSANDSWDAYLKRFSLGLATMGVPTSLKGTTVTVDGRVMDPLQKAAEDLTEMANRIGFAYWQDPQNPGCPIDVTFPPTGGTDSFDTRVMKADSAISRALLTPTLIMNEAEFGTRAQSQTHLEVAVMEPEATAKRFADFLVESIVRRLVWLNYGEQAQGYGQFPVTPMNMEYQIALGGLIAQMTANQYMAPGKDEVNQWISERMGIPKDVLSDKPPAMLQQVGQTRMGGMKPQAAPASSGARKEGAGSK